MRAQYLSTERMDLLIVNHAYLKHLFETHSTQELCALFCCSVDKLEMYKDMSDLGMDHFRIRTLFFLLIDKKSGVTIGEAGFHTWNTKHRRTEIYYFIHLDENKRKGYMTEALNAIIPYGYNECDIHRIEARIEKSNTASLKVVAHYGFVHEGTVRQDYNNNGVMEDSEVYALMATEFNS